MFGKSDKKATVKFHHQQEGFAGTFMTVPLNEGKLLELLKDKLNIHGKLVIERIADDNEIHMTTTRTISYENTESRIDEISDVIRNYIKSCAISAEAHAVFADGLLKGVFGDETHARLKRNSLISKGFEEEKVEIKPIEVNSFKDIY